MVDNHCVHLPSTFSPLSFFRSTCSSCLSFSSSVGNCEDSQVDGCCYSVNTLRIAVHLASAFSALFRSASSCSLSFSSSIACEDTVFTKSIAAARCSMFCLSRHADLSFSSLITLWRRSTDSDRIFNS